MYVKLRMRWVFLFKDACQKPLHIVFGNGSTAHGCLQLSPKIRTEFLVEVSDAEFRVIYVFLVVYDPRHLALLWQSRGVFSLQKIINRCFVRNLGGDRCFTDWAKCCRGLFDLRTGCIGIHALDCVCCSWSWGRWWNQNNCLPGTVF